MKGNKDKCQIMFIQPDTLHVKIGTSQIAKIECNKVLGINNDSKLTFEDHINRICKKARVKLKTLSRISHYMDHLKRQLIVNILFTSQFNYYPLPWMFHTGKLNTNINRLYERCLRLIYSDRISSYEKLFDKDNSVPIHQNNF